MKLEEDSSKKDLDQKINRFNASIDIDKRMYNEDIEGSIAHVTMLGQCGIVDKIDVEKICFELEKIQKEFSYGNFILSSRHRDIYTFIEAELIKRLGDTGKKMNIARSRDDQISLSLRLSLKKESEIVINKLKELIGTLCKKALKNTKTIMPSNTNLQTAQPITFAHHIMAYCEMFLRDIDRINDAKNRMEEMPLGSGNFAHATYPINRSVTTLLLGFEKMTNNSIDAVSDRDFCVEIASALSIVMVHMSRLCEEIILWSSWKFKFLEFDETFFTQVDIMSGEKNPYIAELIRGKSGRIFGNLISILTMLKALPLSHKKDMKEDKEAIFDSIDTVNSCIDVFVPMFDNIKVNKENMRKSASKRFANATDCADYLVKKGVSFKDAYMIVEMIISYCIENNLTFESLPIEKYKEASMKFEEDILEYISLENCIEERNIFGGPAEYNVLEQIKRVRELIDTKS